MPVGLTGLVQIRRALETLMRLDDPNVAPTPSWVGDSAEPCGGPLGQDWVFDLPVMVHEVTMSLRSLGSGLAYAAKTAEDQHQNLVELAEAVTVLAGKLSWLTASLLGAEG